MKLIAVLLPLGFVPALLGLDPARAAWPASTSTAAVPAQQDRYKEFADKFATALANSANDEITKLVRQYQEQAIMKVDSLCARLIENSNAEVEKEFEALRRAWKAAYNNNGFVDKVYEFASLLPLDPVKRAARVKALKDFNPLVMRLEKTRAAGTRDSADYETHATEFEALAKTFEEVGDRFFAGRCWNGYGICFMKDNRGKDENPQKVFLAFGKAIEHWDAVEFKGALYSSTRDYYERLKAELPAGGAANPSAPPPPEAVAASAPIAVALQFQALDLLEIERPNYHHDDLYQMWPQVQLGDVGSSTEISSAKGTSPKITRVSSSKIGIDGDGDGKPEEEVAITGNQTIVKTKIGRGDEQREWAFLFRTGIEQDTFQGLKTNLGAGKEYLSLFCNGAGSFFGMVGETQVRVIDDNVDGLYGSAPLMWNYMGLSADSTQLDIDSLVVGESKRARPWGEYQKIGEAWYKLEVEPGAKTLNATPMTLEAGLLRLDAKGPKLDWLIVRGKGKLANCFYDLAADPKKGTDVPAGEYELCFGILRQGKKQQMLKALILPGKQSPTYTVTAGQTVGVVIGAPYHLAFEYQVEGDKLTVQGKSVTVVGSGGERYERVYNAVLRPEASFRKQGSKRGSKPERMAIVLDMDEMDSNGQRKHGFADVWRPLDLTLPVTAGEPVEVQLVEKKNKLFGNIESEWK